MLNAALTGFLTGLSLILAIGSQNAFVLRQGLVGQHVLPVCIACILSDTILIFLGVAGMGATVRAMPGLTEGIYWGGAVFLFGYGALAMRRALAPSSLRAAGNGASSLWAAVGTALALAWLNPHVYLDTVVLLGAVSLPFSEQGFGMAFAVGASAASGVFFLALGYGARLLAPVMANPQAWRVLDAGIALIMWAIAAGLVAAALSL